MQSIRAPRSAGGGYLRANVLATSGVYSFACQALVHQNDGASVEIHLEVEKGDLADKWKVDC